MELNTFWEFIGLSTLSVAILFWIVIGLTSLGNVLSGNTGFFANNKQSILIAFGVTVIAWIIAGSTGYFIFLKYFNYKLKTLADHAADVVEHLNSEVPELQPILKLVTEHPETVKMLLKGQV
jgi:hypothetical protein